MFSGKPTAVLVLTGTSLAFYSVKDEQREILEFPTTILNKQAILDFEKFSVVVEEFLARNSLSKQHSILILGKDAVFEKTFPKDKEISPEDEEKFLKTVPYDKDLVVIKRLEDEDKTYLLATHKDFYSSVCYTLQKFGWTVDQVVPSTLFDGFDSAKQLEFSEIDQILANAKELEIGNYLSGDDLRKSRQEKTQEKKGLFSKQNIFFLLGISVSCAIVVFLLLFFNIIRTPLPQSMQEAKVTPTAVPPTPTPAPSVLTKDKISVKVLNGTGTPGQAGKVKSALEDLGYKDITTDNADASDATDTIVEASEKISEKDKTELVDELKKIFETVKTKVSTDTASDIIITTGTEK